MKQKSKVFGTQYENFFIPGFLWSAKRTMGMRMGGERGSEREGEGGGDMNECGIHREERRVRDGTR